MSKRSWGGITLPGPSQQFIPKFRNLLGYQELPLDETSVLQLVKLPAIHKDPFDRMLVCQAIANGMTIVTPDPLITQYPVNVVW